ncbi:MAG: DUF1573 domain-containing protein [Muribaculaceae bacterium]
MKQVLLAIMLLGALCAQARWSATVHDFGAIEEDSGRVECRFVLYNDTEEAMAIVSARTTCGCTLSDYPREAFAPGDSAVVMVTFDPAGRPGHFTKYISVETTGTPSKTRLAITGTVIGSVATVAQRFPVDFGLLRLVHDPVMLGEVTGDRVRSVYTEGYNRSADTLQIAVTQTPKWLRVNVAPAKVAPGNQTQIIFYIDPQKCPEYGLVEDSIRLTVNGVERSLGFTINRVEDFSHLTEQQRADAPVAVIGQYRVDFGRIDRAGGVIRATATVENRGKDKLIIRRVYADCEAITATMKTTTVKRGKTAEIVIEVDPSRLNGALLNQRLTIITNDPFYPVQHLRIVGTF